MKTLGKHNAGAESLKNAVHNVASALHGLKRYEEALKLYDQAIVLAKPEGLVQSYWSSINNKVYCLYDAKRSTDASTLLEDELVKAKNRFTDSTDGWYIRPMQNIFFHTYAIPTHDCLDLLCRALLPAPSIS